MNIFNKSLIVSIITFLLDFIFHFLFTNPMESLTYFVIKFLLSFFVAVAMYSLISFKKFYLIKSFISGLIFSTLMSTYYRAWEFGEAHVPFGSRAPDIFLVSRSSLLFPLIWWIGHVSFFFIGVLIADKLSKK